MVGDVSHVFPPNPRRRPPPLLPRIFRPGTRENCFRRSFPASPSTRAAPKRMVRRNSTHPSPDDRPGGEVDSTTYIAATRMQMISRLITVWDNQLATSTSSPALPDPRLSLSLAFIPPPRPFRDDAGHHPHRLPGQECHFYHERRLSPAQTYLVEGGPHLPDLPFLVL